LYQKIDDLQAYINLMDRSVERMEARAEQVDDAYGGNSVKKLFTSIVVLFFLNSPTALQSST
jgi:hypothetical protein